MSLCHESGGAIEPDFPMSCRPSRAPVSSPEVVPTRSHACLSMPADRKNFVFGHPGPDKDGAESAAQPQTGGQQSSGLVDKLYAKHFGPLVAFLSATFGEGPPPPGDIAQQAFERVLKTNSLETARNPKAFLWKVARNIAISARLSEAARSERESRFMFLRGDAHHLPPDHVYRAEETLALAVEVIRSMPKQRREAFLLVRIDGLTHQAAAERLGISRPAVSKHLARAAVQIAEAMDDV